ncbi:hypothetical protein ACNKHW_05780 [Shigella flexneri]
MGNALSQVGEAGGLDVWICCLAAILLMDPVAILSRKVYGSAAVVAAYLHILVSVVSLS